MIRHILAAAAVALFTTGALAQDAVIQGGTGGDSTMNANNDVTQDRVNEDAAAQLPLPGTRTSDSDPAMEDSAMTEDSGVAVEGTGGDSTLDANSDARSDDGQPLAPQ